MNRDRITKLQLCFNPFDLIAESLTAEAPEVSAKLFHSEVLRKIGCCRKEIIQKVIASLSLRSPT
jgi:hypothetical protein